MSNEPSSFSFVRGLAETPLGRALRSGPIRYFDATLEHAARIPRAGGALLVGNHAMTGLDGVVLGALVGQETGRYVRFLGERNLWRLPVLSTVLDALGAVPGERDTAVRLLSSGELCGVYPGGIDDSWKLTDTQRYRLQWGDRRGFAKVAMLAGVPILPVAAHGIDEMYDVVAREPWVGRRILGSPRYDLPLALGWKGTLIPKPVRQRYVVLDPIDTTGDPHDPAAIERVRAATFAALDDALAPLRGRG